MDRERFQKVSRLFEQVCNLPEDERTSFLNEACGDDPGLRDEVEGLIRQDQRSPVEAPLDVLQDDLGRYAADAVSDQSAANRPERIGRYRVLDELGRGGMGVVYRAEQDQPRRIVALKLIRSGAMDSRMLRRFEHEAEVLGRLHHPGIAQIFEAGTEGHGADVMPFFAMELVEGQPLTSYVQERGADLRSRLRLLIAVCEAVHHAHQKGVIHRDLKPANIMVTDTGEPKILDFGVARATDADVALTTVHTDQGQLMGTLPYMSPEQVSVDSQDLDTRSDVYSLGVVAYELIAGRLPYNVAGRSIPQAVSVITNQEPEFLGRIDRRYRGDLETIIAKALEKQRARRYQSALDLAADLTRYLDHEPIEARPPSTFYQMQKFASRHTGLVAGLVVALVILLGALVGMGWLTLRAQSAEQEAKDRALNEERLRRDADRRAQIASAVNDFLDRMLAAPDPWSEKYSGALDVRVVTVLDQAAAELNQGFDGLPDVEVELRDTLGRTYHSLGEVKKALPMLQRVYEMRRDLHGERDRRTLAAGVKLIEAHVEHGERASILETAERLVELHDEVLGVDAPETLNARFALSEILFGLGRLEDAIELTREAADVALDAYGEEDPFTLRAMGNLSVLLLNLGELDEALEIQQEVLDIQEYEKGPLHPEALVSRSNLASVLWRLGRATEAEEHTRAVLEGRIEVLGEDHPDTLNSMNSLIVFLNTRRAYSEAAPLRQRQLQLASAKLGEEHPTVLIFRHNHARALQQRGQLERAEQLCREVLLARERTLPDGHEQTLNSMEVLGLIQQQRDQHEDAEATLGRAFVLAETYLAVDHWMIPWLMGQHGQSLTALGEYEEAEWRLVEAYEALKDLYGPRHSRTMTTRLNLLALYRASGQTDKAAELGSYHGTHGKDQ